MTRTPDEDLTTTLIAEVLKARERVYRVGQPTPLERLPLGGDFETWIKREDLSPINAYKWRGAQNCTAHRVEDGGARGVVAASAGNHAQGVALSARRLGAYSTASGHRFHEHPATHSTPSGHPHGRSCEAVC